MNENCQLYDKMMITHIIQLKWAFRGDLCFGFFDKYMMFVINLCEKVMNKPVKSFKIHLYNM